MPTQNGVRLDDHQSLFPRAQFAGQKDDDGTIAPGQSWSLGLPFEYDDLLAQKSVFQHQFKPGAVQVQGCVEGQGTLDMLCPLAKRL